MQETSLFSQIVQAHLLANAKLIREPKGAVLFRRGQPSVGIFLVRNGSIRLRLESGEGEAVLDRTVSRDAVIGLPATISGERYSLTAMTREESELAYIDRQTLIELMRNDPGVAFEIMHALGEEVLRMRETLVSARQRLSSATNIRPSPRATMRIQRGEL
jgi:CRP-like cAMP-binding protein